MNGFLTNLKKDLVFQHVCRWLLVNLWVDLTSESIRADVEVVIVVVNDVVNENYYFGYLYLAVKANLTEAVV